MRPGGGYRQRHCPPAPDWPAAHRRSLHHHRRRAHRARRGGAPDHAALADRDNLHRPGEAAPKSHKHAFLQSCPPLSSQRLSPSLPPPTHRAETSAASKSSSPPSSSSSAAASSSSSPSANPTPRSSSQGSSRARASSATRSARFPQPPAAPRRVNARTGSASCARGPALRCPRWRDGSHERVSDLAQQHQLTFAPPRTHPGPGACTSRSASSARRSCPTTCTSTRRWCRRARLTRRCPAGGRRSATLRSTRRSRSSSPSS